jgi:hypothetical protein
MYLIQNSNAHSSAQNKRSYNHKKFSEVKKLTTIPRSIIRPKQKKKRRTLGFSEVGMNLAKVQQP